MSDRKIPPMTVYRHPPATSQYGGSMPSRPTSSGAWLGSRTTIARKDTDFTKADEALLRAKAGQTDAMCRLMEARIAAELVYSRLMQLPELKTHAHLLGRAQREHESAMFALNSETERALAQIRLEEARQILARTQPVKNQQSPAPVPSAGLSPSEIEQVLAQVPEINNELRQTLLWALKGRMQEK
jgi:hypothetical protein